jgi:catechol 2,3-dioxygenase-like lactoylglutathione lyase family enzyme
VAKFRHIAVATEDPDATAQFYMDVFEFQWVRKAAGDYGYGHILTDGTINLAVLRFTNAEAMGVEKGASFAGLHHIGMEVDDIDVAIGKVKAAGGVERKDMNEALGITNPEVARGELKFEGPDGVIIDLGRPGFWKNVTTATATGADPVASAAKD